MKRTIVFITFLSFLFACNNSSKSNSSSDTTASQPSAPSDPAAEKGLALVAKSDCFTCHKVDQPSTGPAYTAVAARYAGKEGIADTLAHKIIKGGSGNWGAVPMIPHPAISQDDAKAMAQYVLSLKK
ncbi:MAG: c-type cytochrome [Flavisolibacter sp.]